MNKPKHMNQNKNILKTMRRFALIAAGAVLVTAPLFASDTDDRIESAFSKSYAYKVYLKDDAIKTESRNGVVTLTGQVNESSHRYLAQEAVANLPGVQKVDNRLIIKLEGTEESDTWIRSKVRGVLALHPNVNGSDTEVDIKDGVITLRGEAESEVQKDLTTEYAADVNGVLKVTNMMTVVSVPAKPKATVPEIVDDASITAQVRVILQSHRSTSSIPTQIATTNGVVVVSGVVKNTNEKILVSKLAADISGVKSVVNNMTIAPVASAK